MENNQLVSIIIPAYNAEQYIEDVIRSVQSQSYNIIEIIVVDDGSDDRTFEICQKYSCLDCRIKVLTQPNQGPSAARNLGIKEAIGEYIFFADADDILPCDGISYLIEAAKKEYSDIVIGSIEECTQIISNFQISSNKAIAAAMCGSYMIEQLGLDATKFNLGSPWAKLFKRQLLIDFNLKFPIGITHREDCLFCIDAYRISNRITIIGKMVYKYNMHIDNSLVNRFNIKKLSEIYMTLKLLNEFGQKKGICSQTIIENYAIDIIYEAWADYFTHIKNRNKIKNNYHELKLFIKDKQVTKYLYKISESSFYKKMILQMMKNGNCMLLLICMYIWRIKKNVSHI